MVYWGTTRIPEAMGGSAENQNLANANAAALSANHVQQVHFNPNDNMAPQQMRTPSTQSYSIGSPEQIDLDNAFSGALAVAEAADAQRQAIDVQNAKMLGFDTELDAAASVRGTALEYRRQDIIGELEAHRYFVVLMAYDFQELLKRKRHKLVWEVRFSIREGNNDISKELAAMAAAASRYFGQNTGRLVNSPLPEGRVEVGPIKTITMQTTP
jgi:hypothetical protein